MTSPATLSLFAETLSQEVKLSAETDSESSMLHEAFTQTAFNILADGEIFEDPVVCYHRSRGMEVSGYEIDDEEGRLNLFVSIHNDSGSVPVTVPRQRIEQGFRRLQNYFDWCSKGGFRDIEIGSPGFDMARGIYDIKDNLSLVRLCVITDGKTTLESLPSVISDGIQFSGRLYDITELQRISVEGQDVGEIIVDFPARCGEPLPCLMAESIEDSYQGFMLLIPGDVLKDVYADFGPRLLQRNVRSFLQVRGKVNRGIRDTILNEPEKFLAYNNGITMTAEKVHMSTHGRSIERIDGLQIVNGGQTTASLLAAKSGKADLSKIYVAAKLIEIGYDNESDLIRNVSRYSNTQNGVQEADFSANDPFHVSIEELSRTTLTPQVEGSTSRSYWFYERARGQYQDARGSAGTPAARRRFNSENPSRQRYNKTDVAKFENTWDQLPFVVSRGAQKNFSHFMVGLRGRESSPVDRAYYQRLIAKAILFKETDNIVRGQSFGGYKANIVTYTVAYLSHITNQRIDLNRIWAEQKLSDSLEKTISEISMRIFSVITNPVGNANITEWCKREQCWKNVLESLDRSAFSNEIQSDLIGVSEVRERQIDEVKQFPPEHIENLTRIVELSAESWKLLAQWGAETEAIDSTDRRLALQISRAIQRGREISEQDARNAVMMLDRARHLGYESVANELPD